MDKENPMTSTTPERSPAVPRQPQPPNPLLSVWGWELRRVAANPLSWALALAAFLFFAGMVWFKHAWRLGTEEGFPFVIYGTTRAGMLFEFVNVLMFVFAFILPFVVTEGVARDLRLRTHEVLMTTPLPNWAYVGGRFLAVLSLSLGLASLLLIAYLGMGALLHAASAPYPMPGLKDSLAVWAVVVLPPTLLIAGVGFSLGTLWPHRARVIMLGLVMTWILLFVLGGVLRFNPTSNVMLVGFVPQLVQRVQAGLPTVPPDRQAAWIQQLQAELPDLTGWVLPHYGLACLGVLSVLGAAAGFRRFRAELD